MRNWAWSVTAGIILLLVAAFMFTSYDNVYVTPVVTQGPANPDQASNPPAWERPGNFTKGEVIEVNLLPNIFWAENEAAFDVIDYNHTSLSILYVDINITDPLNTMSHYELWFTYDQQKNHFSLWNASADSFGQGINSTVYLPNKFNSTYTFEAGTAEIDGTYLANVTFAGFAVEYRANGTYVPDLGLYYVKTTFQSSQPNTYLLYVGYAIIPVAFVFLAYGFRRVKTKRKVLDRTRAR